MNFYHFWQACFLTKHCPFFSQQKDRILNGFGLKSNKGIGFEQL